MSNDADRQPIDTPPAGTDPRFDEMAAREETVNTGAETRAGETRPGAIPDRGAGRETRTDPMSGYRIRFAEVQARFIDDPHAAVEGARSLVEEAVDRMMQAIGADLGDKADTERMRLAIQRYREVMDRIGSTTT